MPRHSLQATTRAIALRLLHLWRIVMLCATITHEREHPALAILILVPLNHLLFNLTASLDPAAPGPSTRSSGKRLARVLALYVVTTIGLVWWYGSFGTLRADLVAFSATWEWWVLVFTIVALTVLYRPLVSALTHLVGVTGLKDFRLWSALGWQSVSGYGATES